MPIQAAVSTGLKNRPALGEYHSPLPAFIKVVLRSVKNIEKEL